MFCVNILARARNDPDARNDFQGDAADRTPDFGRRRHLSTDTTPFAHVWPSAVGETARKVDLSVTQPIPGALFV